MIDDSELNEFIERSKEGINTIVGENGAKISGGQIQRIVLLGHYIAIQI